MVRSITVLSCSRRNAGFLFQRYVFHGSFERLLSIITWITKYYLIFCPGMLLLTSVSVNCMRNNFISMLLRYFFQSTPLDHITHYIFYTSYTYIYIYIYLVKVNKIQLAYISNHITAYQSCYLSCGHQYIALPSCALALISLKFVISFNSDLP